MRHTTENSKEVLQDSIGFKVAMSFKPFINPKCSEHMEIVKDMARAINSAIIHSPNGIVFNQGYKEGKKHAVNERQKLINSNRRLIGLLKRMVLWRQSETPYELLNDVTSAINNAKNLLP